MSVNIGVVIGVPATGGNPVVLRTAEIAAADYLASLIDDLELPMHATVQAVDSDRYRLIIGGVAVDCDAASARDLPLAIYRNRRLLATKAVAAMYGSTLWSQPLSSYSAEKLRELMAACLERNLRVGRLSEVLRGVGQADLWDTWELLHRVHRERELKVSVEYGPEVTDFADVTSHGLAVQEQLFERTGLLCPLLRAAEASVAADEWRLCLNDVRLPLRQRRSGDQDAVAAIVGDLTRDADALLTRDGISRRMSMIEWTLPVLKHEAVRRVGLNRIIAILGVQVREAKSIRDLERILDELTLPLVPYELADDVEAAVTASIDLTARRKPGDGKREATPEEYASVLVARLA